MNLVNFCYRSIRINKVHLLRSRMQPFWIQRDGSLKPTGYGRDATAFVETRRDQTNLMWNGYDHVILLQPGVNCTARGEEFHFTADEDCINVRCL